MQRDAIVIGAGPGGLAAAQQLRASGMEPLVIEKADRVGAVWRRHYDRLRLHTPRIHSALPGMPMPRAFGRYPSRDDVVAYLESYARKFDIAPMFGTQAQAIRRAGNGWLLETSAGDMRSPVVVVATGWADFPHVPQWPGMQDYAGEILHSSAYVSGARFKGRRVLVVGFGNSGAEIALDLCEQGAAATISQRSPVRILPRDLFGIPVLSFAIAQQLLPPRVADFINEPALRLTIGSISSLGLRRSRKGALQMIAEDERVPALDVGTVAKIRAGAIAVRGGVERFTRDGVVFADQDAQRFDAIVLATGFRPDLRALLPDTPDVLDLDGRPKISDAPTTAPGLYFIGAKLVATGQLRQIAIGAKAIARAVRDLRANAAVSAPAP